MRTVYKTYEFKGDKDPAIYIAKTCIELYAIDSRLTMVQAMKDIAAASRVHPRTLWCWFSGATRSPKTETWIAVINATGNKVVAGGISCTGLYRYTPKMAAYPVKLRAKVIQLKLKRKKAA